MREGESAPVGAILATVQENGSSSSAEPRTTPTKTLDSPEPADAPHSSPAVRRLAMEHGLDLSDIAGTGPRGRVTREDVLAALPEPPLAEPVARAPVEPPTPTPPPPQTAGGRAERREPMSARRRTIAHRLVEAQQTAAMLTTFNEADMSAVMSLRKRRNEAFQERHGIKLGFMSFFAKAVVGGLKQFPYLNAEIDGDDILLKEYYDLGIAVGVPEGLVVPVVRNADRKTFAQLEREIADLAARARESRLRIAELQGGTFTITNGGVYGSLMSTPILNAPQVGILGMHRIQERPVVLSGEIVARPMMYLALSYDHRIVDGSDAVRFLVAVKNLVEDPEALLLEG